MDEKKDNSRWYCTDVTIKKKNRKEHVDKLNVTTISDMWQGKGVYIGGQRHETIINIKVDLISSGDTSNWSLRDIATFIIEKINA